MTNILAKDLDEKFDDGEEIISHKISGTTNVFDTKIKKVNVDFPLWMVEALDVEAKRIGITRQALIKTIVDGALKKTA